MAVRMHRLWVITLTCAVVAAGLVSGCGSAASRCLPSPITLGPSGSVQAGSTLQLSAPPFTCSASYAQDISTESFSASTVTLSGVLGTWPPSRWRPMDRSRQ